MSKLKLTAGGSFEIVDQKCLIKSVFAANLTNGTHFDVCTLIALFMHK